MSEFQTFAKEQPDGNTLTYEKLSEMLALIEPAEFRAFTVTPSVMDQLMVLPDREEKFSPVLIGAPPLAGLDIYTVAGQLHEVIEWKEKNQLNLYLETMGERDGGDAVRRAALERLTEIARLDFANFVLDTLHCPTDYLVKVSNAAELNTDAAKTLAEALKEATGSVQKLEVSLHGANKPKHPAKHKFYRKFASKKFKRRRK